MEKQAVCQTSLSSVLTYLLYVGSCSGTRETEGPTGSTLLCCNFDTTTVQKLT